MTNEKSDIQAVVESFGLKGQICGIQSIKNGLINKTYLLTMLDGKQISKYIIQQLNTHVFGDISKLMNNCVELSKNVIEKTKQQCGKVENILVFLQNKEGDFFIQIDDRFFRVENYINGSISFDFPMSKEMASDAGRIIAEFEKMFLDFDLKRLEFSIPMHNTPIIVEEFDRIIKEDPLKRAQETEVKNLIKKFKQFESYKNLIMEPFNNGIIPARAVHNDTKFNNILFSEKTLEPLTLIDFDDSMVGTWLFDYADAIRYMCNMAPGLEDETNLSKVKFNLPYFEAFTNSYLNTIGENLTKAELMLMPISPAVIAYELGVRFLTDYINGDKEFAIRDNQSNLQRSKVQFKMFEEILSNLPEITKIVDKKTKSLEIRKIVNKESTKQETIEKENSTFDF